jgi:competence protein CoiA
MDGSNRGLFFRLSEAREDDPLVTKATLRGGIYHAMHEIADQVIGAYRGHHQFDWVRPRRTWLDATSPVYIDFGEDYLVRLETYDESQLPCIRIVMKRDLVERAMVETDARSVLRKSGVRGDCCGA